MEFITGGIAFYCVFGNIRTLKFKPQPMVYIFRCRQSSKWTSQEKKTDHFRWAERSHPSVVIG